MGQNIRKVAVIGAGVIGAGWVARFVLNGLDVSLYDSDPEVERKVNAVIGNARRAAMRLTPDVQLEEGKVTFCRSIEEAVAGADFVQESLPEREDLKRSLLAVIDLAAKPDVVIASSTSGLLPSALQSDMSRPERFIVAHPFNPVYLLPLVELCAGRKTEDTARETAAALYTRIGMHPLTVRAEVDGFIADRLLEALWREALWLVNDGVATTSEIDDAIRYGAGLRWSFMGTFLIYRLAGGEEGMHHFLSQFGPALKLPWTKLEAPELTGELIDRIVKQSDEQAGGIDLREYEQLRDDCLVDVLSALRANDFAAGAVVKQYEKRLSDEKAKQAPEVEGGELSLLRPTVLPAWIDYNGHMTEWSYLKVFGDTTDALLDFIGAGTGYVADGYSYYTVESHLRHLGQAYKNERLRVGTRVLGVDTKRLHVFHTLYGADGETPIATAEHMLLHVDAHEGKACPGSPHIIKAAEAILASQAGMPAPEGCGNRIAMPKKKVPVAGE